MYVKVQCPCGTRFAFDVLPVAGRMPVRVNCPWCGVDGTELANHVIQSLLEKLVVPASATAVPVVGPALDIKVHCPCGTRYIFEVHPVDGRMPVPVHCPHCGVEGTGQANMLIRQALDRESDIRTDSGIAMPRSLFDSEIAPRPVIPATRADAAPPVRPVAPAAATAAAAPVPVAPMRLTAEHAVKNEHGKATPVKYCPAHRKELAADFCRYCERPICVKCMRSFGYFCSPRCRHEAEMRGMTVPECPIQRPTIGARLFAMFSPVRRKG